MKTRLYAVASATIFALVSALHLVRLVWQVPVQVGPCYLPVWFSWGGLIAAAALSLWGYRVARMRKEG